MLSEVPKTMSTPSWADPFEAELGRLPEKLRRFFLSRGVRTEDEARDLVQETLLRVLQRVSRGEPLESPEAYSLGVAKNVFFEYCRRVQRANKHEGLSGVLDLAATEDPLSDALSSSRKLILRKALELLPARMRVLLVRRFVEEVPSRTIAREEGITTDAVDMRVYRAKRELKKKMDSTAARSAVRAMREEERRNPSGRRGGPVSREPAVERDRIREYLLRSLADADRARFEESYFADDALLDRVEAEEDLLVSRLRPRAPLRRRPPPLRAGAHGDAVLPRARGDDDSSPPPHRARPGSPATRARPRALRRGSGLFPGRTGIVVAFALLGVAPPRVAPHGPPAEGAARRPFAPS